MIKNATWITPKRDFGEVCPVFIKNFYSPTKIDSARLYITANGTYEAIFNGKRVSDYVLAPGWTMYSERHQYQSYDLTFLASSCNTLEVTVGTGWQRGRIYYDR